MSSLPSTVAGSSALVPVEADTAEREVHPHAVEARHVGEPRLDGAGAAGAVDAVDREVEVAGAVVGRLHKAADVDGGGRLAVAQRQVGGRAARRRHGTSTRFFERKSCWWPLTTMRSSSHTPAGTAACPR